MASEQLVATLKANPISVACGALALALGIGIYVRSDRVPESEATLAEKTSLGERIDANLKNGAQLSEQYTQLSNYRQQIETRLVRQDEIAKNLQFFYKLESDTGAKLIDCRQTTMPNGKPVRVKAAYSSVGYSISVRGDYPRLLDFLRRLESKQRFCRVFTANVAVGGASEKDRSGEVTLNLGLELLGQP